jgi:hypothetical protein
MKSTSGVMCADRRRLDAGGIVGGRGDGSMTGVLHLDHASMP